MLSHEDVRTIISALGTGIGTDEFDFEKRRYGKVIIMTDADIDGAHIRTLLLTFFFRQMKELIRGDAVYIAQPPLFEITRNRKKNYVLNEYEMNKLLTGQGLKGTELHIRQEDGQEQVVAGEELEALLEALATVDEQLRILRHRGVNMQTLVSQDQGGPSGLPAYRIIVDSQEEYFHGEEEYSKRRAELAARVNDEDNTVSIEVITQELHEVERLNEMRLFMAQYNIQPEDYFRRVQQTVAGELLPTKFALVDAEGIITDVPNPQSIIKGIRDLGSRGIEIKRFKGLGEMDAEELWETTMDPQKRTLLRVKLEDAAEADRLFSILMGDNVAQRRSFIEEHALEVKNLDV
jgi:DNA gyrase subunit B